MTAIWEETKHTGRTISIVLLMAGLAYMGFWFGQLSERRSDVVEKVMQIQRTIGCIDIDGDWGRETKRKYKIAKRMIEIEDFNQYAQEYMTESGGLE